jgi:hypothetical protein
LSSAERTWTWRALKPRCGRRATPNFTPLLALHRRKNHPNAIINSYKRNHPDPDKPKTVKTPSTALSPALQERDERIKELEEELASARANTTAPTGDIESLRAAYAAALASKVKAAKSKAAQKRAAKEENAALYKAVKAIMQDEVQS